MPTDLPQVRCPAGSPISESSVSQGAACVCRVVNEVVDARTNAKSYRGFCAGNYERCPSWREDQARGRELAKELHAEGSSESSRMPILVSGAR